MIVAAKLKANTKINFEPERIVRSWNKLPRHKMKVGSLNESPQSHLSLALGNIGQALHKLSKKGDPEAWDPEVFNMYSGAYDIQPKKDKEEDEDEDEDEDSAKKGKKERKARSGIPDMTRSPPRVKNSIEPSAPPSSPRGVNGPRSPRSPLAQRLDYAQTPSRSARPSSNPRGFVEYKQGLEDGKYEGQEVGEAAGRKAQIDQRRAQARYAQEMGVAARRSQRENRGVPAPRFDDMSFGKKQKPLQVKPGVVRVLKPAEIAMDDNDPFGENENWQQRDLDEEEDAKNRPDMRGMMEGYGRRTALWNDQIDEFFKHEPQFSGTYAMDEVKDIPKQIPQGFVVNTANHNKAGEHWQAVYITPDSVEFYDSYGDQPDAALVKQIKRKLLEWHVPVLLKWKVNKIGAQKDNTSTCGYFAMRFLDERFRGVPFTKATRFESRSDEADKAPDTKGVKHEEAAGEAAIKKEFDLI